MGSVNFLTGGNLKAEIENLCSSVFIYGSPHPACGHVDSPAPARSARCGLSALPNSFRRFPNGSSLPIRCGEGNQKAAPLPKAARVFWI
jgi:hypothetical protein